MRKKPTLWMALVALLVTLPVTARTLDEMIATNVESRGGLEALKAVETARMTGKYTMPQGVEAPLVIEFKRPDKTRLEIEMQGMIIVQAYDGEIGWEIMPFRGKTDPEKMAGDQLKDIKATSDLIDGFLVDWEAKGRQVELIGTEEVDGTEAYKIKVTRDTGDVLYVYLDTEHCLAFKAETKRDVQGTEMEFTVTIGDYKEVGDVVMAHSVVVEAEGMGFVNATTLEKVELNVEIDDERFTMPAPGHDPNPYTDLRELPEGPVGELIAELVKVVNANDRDLTRAFISERFGHQLRAARPIEHYLSLADRLYHQSRGFDFYGVRQFERPQPANQHVVIVRNRLTERWEAFVLTVDPGPPARIAELDLARPRPPHEVPPLRQGLSDAEIVAELEAFVERLAEADVFSGTVLLAKDGEVLFKGAYGLASKRFNVPNRIDTKFNLGSMNKMFTAVAIGQLVEAGKLAFDDPLSKFLGPDWLPAEITEKIRIKHLLTHTSGLGSFFKPEFFKASRLVYREIDDYKPLVVDETLAFEPGTSRRYSNTGMFLLGVVIEKVTGHSYFDYVRDRVTKPAGMVNTDCYEMDRPVPNLAIGYDPQWTADGLRYVNNLYQHPIKGGPAGGGFSTVEDLLRFDVALRSGALVSPEMTATLRSPKPELSSPAYGYGFRIVEQAGDRIVGHSGGFMGISSNLDMFLDSGYTAAVMSNYTGGRGAMMLKMRELLGRRR